MYFLKLYIKWHITADTVIVSYVQTDLSKQLPENRHILLPHPVAASIPVHLTAQSPK